MHRTKNKKKAFGYLKKKKKKYQSFSSLPRVILMSYYQIGHHLNRDNRILYTDTYILDPIYTGLITTVCSYTSIEYMLSWLCFHNFV